MAYEIDTDPQARLFWRKKAHLLALVVKSRYGEEGWSATTSSRVTVRQRWEVCSSRNNARRLLVTANSQLDQRLYRRPGQSMNEFVNETHVEIRRAGGGS